MRAARTEAASLFRRQSKGPVEGGTAVRDHAIVAALWLVLTAAGEYLVDRWVRVWPVAASAEAQIIDHSFFLLLRLVVPVFSFVVALLLFAAAGYRRAPENPDGAAGRRDNRWFSWGWFGVTAALNVLFVLNPGLTGLAEVRGSADADLVVQVRAKQWSWSFTYPDYGVSIDDQLVLPVGRRVRFEITSEDVIHSFWVPAFRLKQDAVPGQVTTLYVTPDREISTREDLNVRVQCAELCGAGHTPMRAAVQVVDAETFERWVASRVRR